MENQLQLPSMDDNKIHVLNNIDKVGNQEMDVDIESIRPQLAGDETEEGFDFYLIRDYLECKNKVALCQKTLEKHLLNKPIEQQDQVFKKLIKFASTIRNETSLKYLFNVFHNFLENNIVQSKTVCEHLINSESLSYDLKYFWIMSFELLLTWIHTVDYKGVREIMKGCFKKSQSLPNEINRTIMPQVLILERLIKTIFDREKCLLPAYFIVNEVYRPFMENSHWPHWKLSGVMADCVKSFRSTAQMLSIIGHASMLPIVEHSEYGEHFLTPWKLDPVTLKLNVKGNLPYDKSLLEPQTKLLRYVLEQPYSRDMVCSMLGLQKPNKQANSSTIPHCTALEEQLVELVIDAMERVESKSSFDIEENHALWLHLSSQLLYCVLHHLAVFQNIINLLCDKLLKRGDLRKARDHLMWLLLQFISGSISNKPLEQFLTVLKLFDLLYPESDPLPEPNIEDVLCTQAMAASCIWVHLICKAKSENKSFNRSIPNTLRLQYTFLQMQVTSTVPPVLESDFRIALLCNAYSTNTDFLNRYMGILVDSLLGSQRGNQQLVSTPALLNNSSMPAGPTTPLTMALLDSLTIHAKLSLIHRIVTHVIQLAQSKSNKALSPALVETYSRLLVYTEIETLGIKSFISQLLPTVFKSHAWGILHTLLEMFSYRMHHIQPHYRVQLLSHLHSLAAVPQTNQTQLHLCVESTALRLITGLGNNEVQPQLSRFLSEPKTLVSSESEELNRALVLTLARSMHITGTGTDSQSGMWCIELLKTIMQNTPHNWAPHTLRCFPAFLSEYFQQNAVQKENHQQLNKSVEEEYRNWTSMTNDNDIIGHFSVPKTPPLFLCLLWKMILDTDRINPIAYKILERIGARALSAHLRKFCDYLVMKFVTCKEGGGQSLNKCVDAINCMIWKYNVITIDRLVLCLALRTQESTNDAQVCFPIIQLLLFKGNEFPNRVTEFVRDNSPEHWKQSNWHEKHLAFHRTFPETFVTEEPGSSSSNSSLYQTLPVYFGNICLRFLPVFDIVIHRCLELEDLQPVNSTLETLLGSLGCLYKFHDRPVTYLYNTLHYYERRLQARPPLTKRLVKSILSPFCESRAPGWSLSEPYQQYMMASDSCTWVPMIDYYVKLIQRLVDVVVGKVQISSLDWRFNEFPNPSVYALYITCVELMALPAQVSEIANNILDVITAGYPVIPKDQIQSWINCIGLIMSALPVSYWQVWYDRLIETIKSPELQNWKYNQTPFSIFNFVEVNNSWTINQYVYILAIAHAIWHHAGVGQISALPQFVKEKLTPHVKSEEQYLFFCHLIGPFLYRFRAEPPSPCVVDLMAELFIALQQVDAHQEEMKYIDSICDLLYHIKYQYVGNLMATEMGDVIRKLRPAIRKRMTFVVPYNATEVPSTKKA